MYVENETGSLPIRYINYIFLLCADSIQFNYNIRLQIPPYEHKDENAVLYSYVGWLQCF